MTEISSPVTRPLLAIVQELEQSIRLQQLQTGDRLPSERELQERFHCTRITVREALLRLAARGLIYRQPRRGWFVTPPRLVCNPARRLHFLHDARAQGFQPSTELISCEQVTPDEQIQGLLNTRTTYKLCRLRRLNGRPVLLEHIYLPANDFPGLAQQPLEQSLTDLLRDRYSIWITGEEARIRSTALDDDHAELLQVSPGTPSVKLERIRYDRNSRAVEVDRDYWLHDAIELHSRS